MARHESALKAARQALKHQARNQATLAKVRTEVKKLRASITAKADKKALEALLNDVQSILMKAANKNIIKHGTASRQVARLSTAIQRG